MRTSASLPMYDQPGARGALSVIWRHVTARLAQSGLPAPPQLIWPRELSAHWCARDLFVSQTCARPFRAWVHRSSTALGAFDFGLPGCPPGYYASVIVMRQDETRPLSTVMVAGRIAVNSLESQSGYGALAEFGPLPDAPLITGSHAASLRAVQTGRADFAALDAVSWRFMSRRPGAVIGISLRGQTTATPGLPLITGRRHLAARLRTCLAEAVATAPSGPKHWLGLRGFVPFTDAQFLGGLGAYNVSPLT